MSPVSSVIKNVQKKDKLLGAILASTKTVAISFGRTFYALWLQVTGLIFVGFVIKCSADLFRQYTTNHFANRRPFWWTITWLTIFLWFTLVSFRKASRTLKK
jgi:cell division protein FtsW (lipid II flippase)